VLLFAPEGSVVDLPYLWFLVAFHGLVPTLAWPGFASSVEGLLVGLGWERRDIAEAFAGLRRHGAAPERLEEKLVHDANLIEVLGAFGVAKAFTKGGAERQSYEETLASFERNLAAADFATSVGRQRAEDGRRLAQQFVRQLRAELSCTDLPVYSPAPWPHASDNKEHRCHDEASK
jgi:hypothetical protein